MYPEPALIPPNLQAGTQRGGNQNNCLPATFPVLARRCDPRQRRMIKTPGEPPTGKANKKGAARTTPSIKRMMLQCYSAGSETLFGCFVTRKYGLIRS